MNILKPYKSIMIASTIIGSTFLYKQKFYKPIIFNDASSNNTSINDSSKINLNLNLNSNSKFPVISRKEIMKHTTHENRIWVTYQDGVYDITEFLKIHPGGTEKIMLAAGNAIDPFWEMYSFHKEREIKELLTQYKIGQLDPSDIIKPENLPNFDKLKAQSVWRSQSLLKLMSFPYCAECSPEKVIDNYYTTKENFFVRNHNLVPEIDVENYKLKLNLTIPNKTKLKLTLNDLKTNYRKVQIESIIMCTGNRRAQMNKPQKPRGLQWNVGAIANGIWTGVSIREILTKHNYTKENSKGLHLIAEGFDKDIQGFPYSISIPLETIFDMKNDILVAYSYNNEDIPYEHGYPVRLIVPGHVGVRNVKWLKSIEISDKESQGAFQQKDYKLVPKETPWEKADYSKIPAIMKYEVNSVIIHPKDSNMVNFGEDIELKGYAIGYYGNVVKKIEVSWDKGENWEKVDNMRYSINEYGKSYGWTLWDYRLEWSRIKESVDFSGGVEVWVRAEDVEGNKQPVSCEDIWNVRGLANNSYHRVRVNFKESDVKDFKV